MATILVAETEPDRLLAMVLVLRSLGYVVLEANTQNEALFVCRNHPRTIHAVVMPNALGHRSDRLMAQLRSLRPDLRGLLIGEPECLGLTEADDCIYLDKPFHLEDLADRMRILLGNGEGDAVTLYKRHNESRTCQASQIPYKSIAGIAFGEVFPAMRRTLRWSCIALAAAIIIPILLLIPRRESSISSPSGLGGLRTLKQQSMPDKSDQQPSMVRGERSLRTNVHANQVRISSRARIKVRAPQQHHRTTPARPINRATAPVASRFIAVNASAKEVREAPAPAYSSPSKPPPTPSSATGATSGGEPAARTFPAVSVQEHAESQSNGLARKLSPLFRGFRPAPEFEPPSPVRKSIPFVQASLRQRLRSAVVLDVRVYISKAGKVDYAELLTNLTEGNRELATLAVFDARHWEFSPAHSGTHVVPGRAILCYQFAPSEFAISKNHE